MASSEETFAQHRADMLASIHRLTGPRYEVYFDPDTDDRRIIDIPSLYDQLVSEMSGRQGNRTGSPRSIPPVWVDAMRWKMDVDKLVHTWAQRHPIAGASDPAAYLRAMDSLALAPADHAFCAHVAATVEEWVARIDALLSERTTHGLRNTACPECKVKHVRRRDTDGQWSKVEALQVSVEGAVCLHCRCEWSSRSFAFLGRVLGCEAYVDLGDEVEIA